MAKKYSGGIEIATGFKISNPNPIADYMVVEFLTDLDTIPNQFIGMESFVLANNTSYVKKSTGWEAVGGNVNQDNKIKPVYLIINGDISESKVATTINASINFTVSDIEIPIIYVYRLLSVPTPQVLIYKYFLTTGKGAYGPSGAIVLTQDNLQLVYQQQATPTSIIQDPSTDVFFIEDLDGITISEYVNSITPPYVIQSQNEGYTIFQVGNEDELISYLFLGTAGSYGDGFSQTEDSDFQLLSDDIDVVQNNIVKNIQLDSDFAGTPKSQLVSLINDSDGFTVSDTEIVIFDLNPDEDDEIIQFIWAGGKGVWGSDGTPISENQLIQIVKETRPVSALNYGMVDNTPLQELGGVDKTINGIRIGKGNNNLPDNMALGGGALSDVTSGDYNLAIGSLTLKSNTIGQANLGVGAGALQGNINGNYNTAIGAGVLQGNINGNYNTGVGSGSFYYCISGSRNTGVGLNALQNLISGSTNTAIGGGALFNVTTASGNVGIGPNAGGAITIGAANVIIGLSNSNAAPNQITVGSNNLILSPGTNGTATGIIVGSGNVVIGRATGLASGSTNTIVISDGVGNIALRKETNGTILLPNLTRALINADTTGRAVVTKEYLTGATSAFTSTIITGGTATFVGDDSTTTLLIPHGLGSTPISHVVTRNWDSNGNLFQSMADATNITVTFVVGPPMTGENIVLNWIAFK